jgi:hypothetical protein
MSLEPGSICRYLLDVLLHELDLFGALLIFEPIPEVFPIGPLLHCNV